jgi:hypothetical protein
VLDRASPEELRELLQHVLAKAGAPKLMTPELVATLSDHSQGNLRALMNMGSELLGLAAHREARQIDEQLFFETFAAPATGTAQGGGAPAVNAATLPVEPAWRLATRPDAQRWLVSELWAEQAVGIVGGEPKCCKSFLALDLAVAVASGRPCLRRFAVPNPGRVLLYAAEDALHVVRQRLDGICAAGGCRLTDLDVQVITAPILRLDLPADRAALERTLAGLQPRLLILDPFVRLHRIDENASGEVAPLLAYLRELQRRYAASVLLVHHARKSAGAIRAGQALRGSSEFHAWGDSNLYLRRTGDALSLTIEHRAAPSPPNIQLELHADDEALALRTIQPSTDPVPPPAGLDERITAALHEAAGAMSVKQLRTHCRVRNATLHEHLAALAASGRLQRTADGYRLADRN